MKSIIHNKKARGFLIQGAFVIGVLVTFAWLFANVSRNIRALGSSVGFGFVTERAGFPITDSWLAYSPANSYLYAYFVGLTNTMSVAVLVIVISTILGFILALGRISNNYLVRTSCTWYIEILRNTPVPVQLLFWYTVTTALLPRPNNPANPLPGIYGTVRGFFVPWLNVEGSATVFIALTVVVSTLVVAICWFCYRSKMLMWRFSYSITFAAVIGLILFVCLAELLDVRMHLNMPQHSGRKISGGMSLSPEFVLLILALSLYSAALAGEIIRSGISAVSKGQAEAGRALGMKDTMILFKIVLPQGLRIVIPPMANQYISVIKYTTLAMIIGYNDVTFVISSAIDQSNRAIEGVSVLMITFFCLNIVVSSAMNWLNRRVAIVTR